jgi:hypothetical protein
MAEQEKVDLIVTPDFLVHPGLIERIKGYSLKTLLDNTALPVLVYPSGDTALNECPINSCGTSL